MKFSFTKNPNLFYKESKSNKIIKNLSGGSGGGGSVARVSVFFFQKNPSLSRILFEGVTVREEWPVQINLFYKDSKSKKYFFLEGGWGGGGGGAGKRGGGGGGAGY